MIHLGHWVPLIPSAPMVYYLLNPLKQNSDQLSVLKIKFLMAYIIIFKLLSTEFKVFHNLTLVHLFSPISLHYNSTCHTPIKISILICQSWIMLWLVISLAWSWIMLLSQLQIFNSSVSCKSYSTFKTLLKAHLIHEVILYSFL